MNYPRPGAHTRRFYKFLCLQEIGKIYSASIFSFFMEKVVILLKKISFDFWEQIFVNFFSVKKGL